MCLGFHAETWFARVWNNLFVILKTYGYEHMLTLSNLEKVGLLKLQTSSRNNYPTIRKTLKLWMEDANEQARRRTPSSGEGAIPF